MIDMRNPTPLITLRLFVKMITYESTMYQGAQVKEKSKKSGISYFSYLTSQPHQVGLFP